MFLCEGFFVKNICRTTSHLHLHIFPSAHLHLHIYISAPLHICTSTSLLLFTSAHLQLCSSSHLHICTSHIFISRSSFLSLLRRGRCRRSATKRNPLRRSCMSSTRNAGEIALWIGPAPALHFLEEVSYETLSLETWRFACGAGLRPGQFVVQM